MTATEIFDLLWKQYSTQNPSVNRIHTLLKGEGETIANDHVAFRTFNDPRVNIEVLSRPFISAGYKPAGEYRFPAKKLYAMHFELEGYPRVFISQLLLEEFSESLQKTIKSTIDRVPSDKLADPQLIVSGAVFGTPSHATYLKLREESEYAAWVYAFGYCANHFTVSINHLNKYDSIEKLNAFLKENGFPMNTSGGEIKGTPEQLLEQSSILADKINLEFQEGAREIPSCYYEFARRYSNDNGELFSGFIAGSADKIFESTDFR